MAEPPSSQQDTDPAECDTVKKKPCSDGHSQMVPATLQLQVQSLRPTSEEKVDMIKKWSDEAYQLMQRINKGNDALIAAEPRIDSLSETEYPRMCEAVLKWLQLLLSVFPSTDTQLECRILKTLEHLRDNDFLISVFGRFSSGKSTLLNAVLADECLPASEQIETMVVVKIAHGRDIHPGCCKSSSCEQKCPLLSDADCHILAKGAQNICKALEDVDQKVKDREMKVTSQLTITAHVPVIAEVQKPWRVFLVDNPGFSADDDGINNLVQTAIETSHAYMLTLDYNTIQDKANTKTFQDIFKKDKSVFDDKVSRLVIVVTRLDTHFQNVRVNKRLSLPDLRKHAQKLVCNAVKKAVGVSISDAKVVPVFGMWALDARQLKCLQDSQSLEQAKNDLEQFFTGPSGEGQKVSADKSPDEVVEILEKESGIRRLEEEIQNMVRVSGSGWIRSIQGDCSSYVEAALTVLGDKISLLHTVMMEQDKKWQQSREHQKHIGDIRQAFVQNLKCDSSSPVAEQLRECYAQDVKDFSERAKVKLIAFEKQCRKKLAKGRISAQSFHSDLRDLLEEVIDEQGFKNIYKLIEKLRVDAETQKTCLETSAAQYCNHDSPSSDQPEEGNFKSVTTLAETKSRDIIEDLPNLQEIRRNYRDDAAVLASYAKSEEDMSQSSKNQTFWTGLWEMLKRSHSLWDALFRKTLNAESHEFEDEVQQILSGYFDEIQEEIVTYFFNDGYREYVIARLKNSSKQFTEPVKRQDKEMNVMGAALKKMQMDIDGLTKWRENLTHLQKLLHQQTGVYKQKYFQSSQAEQSVAGLQESPASADTMFPTTDQSSQAEQSVAGLQESPASADTMFPTTDQSSQAEQSVAGLQESPASADTMFPTTDQSSQAEQSVAGLQESPASADTMFPTTDQSSQAEQSVAGLQEFPASVDTMFPTTDQRHQVQTRLNVYPGNKVPSVSNQSEARVRIYWTLERRERKQNVKCSDFKSDFKDDALSTCEAAASRLTAFNAMYPGLLVTFSAFLIRKWEQVDKKTISIALFGHVTSGKSMLVNAILTDSVLPVGKTVKSVEVRIRNGVQVHKGQCQKSSVGKTCPQCPVLLKLNGSKLVELKRGASNIARMLAKIDDTMRDKAKPIFIVEGFGPMLDAACIPPWKVHLVENTGYEGLTSREETNRFKREVQAANAYIFTLPYKDRKNDVHYELLGKLIEADESIFRENRITIVITYFEEWYKDHQRPTVQEVKDDICCSIKDKVGACHIPKDCLITVCGEWANTARKLQSMPLEQLELLEQLERLKQSQQLKLKPLEELKQTATGNLHVYKEVTGGRDANEQLQSVEIASQLLAASEINRVEQRVMTMAATCSEDSITMLCNRFNWSLKEAADYLDTSSTVIRKFYEEKRSECTKFETCYATIDEQLRAKRDTKHVLKNVQCLKSIEDMGMEKCQEVLAQASERDLSSLQKDLNMKLNGITMFQSAWDMCYSHSTDVTRILKFMQETAGRMLQTKAPKSEQATKAGQRPENEATPTIRNVEEFMETILKSTGSFEISEDMRNTSNDQFKENILEKFRGHMQSVAKCTIQHMEDYCLTVVENAIRSFESEFKESLNQRNEELKMLMSETEKWSFYETRKIEEYRDHLIKLRRHLEVKARECRMQLEEKKRKDPCV